MIEMITLIWIQNAGESLRSKPNALKFGLRIADKSLYCNAQ